MASEIFFSFEFKWPERLLFGKRRTKQRDVQMLGEWLQLKLVSVQEQMITPDIFGFVGKPETAKKKPGATVYALNT